MAETGVQRSDDGGIVVTTIFSAGELEGYLDTSQAAGEAAPVTQGETAGSGQGEPAPDETGEQPSAEAGPPEGHPSLQGPPYTSGEQPAGGETDQPQG